MDAGRWSSRQTMESCYQHADEASVLAVMQEPSKLRDGNRRVGMRNGGETAAKQAETKKSRARKRMRDLRLGRVDSNHRPPD